MILTTRFARVQQTVASLRTTSGTQVVSPRRASPRPNVAQLFNEQQRVMASALREEPRPGLFVFASHHRYGLVARLWLEATQHPRAGLIGRHDEVDLALPLDEALSLRHLMFVVRRHGSTVRFVALDLESNNGLRLESHREVKLVEAEGPLILSASEFVLFCFPTGAPPPWDHRGTGGWTTLAARAPIREEHQASLADGTAAGRLGIMGPLGARAAVVGCEALRRGVLIGRDPRCDLVLREDTISRVHATLLQLDDQLFIIDAGSTNGLWRGDERLHLGRLEHGDALGLGHDVILRWHDVH